MKEKIKFFIVLIFGIVAITAIIYRKTIFKYLPKYLGGLQNRGRLLYFDRVWKLIDDSFYNRRDYNGVKPFLRRSLKLLKQNKGYSVHLLKLKRMGGVTSFKTYLFSFDPRYFKFAVHVNLRREEINTFFRPGMVFGVNASFFDKRGRILGLVVSNGDTINSQSRRKNGYFLVYKNKINPVIGIFNNLPLHELRQAVMGYPLLMNDGIVPANLFKNTEKYRKISRRTVVANLIDGRICFLVTDTLLTGLSFHELPIILGGIGARDALNFDGGGSTQCIAKLNDFYLDIGGRDRVPVIIGVYPKY